MIREQTIVPRRSSAAWKLAAFVAGAACLFGLMAQSGCTSASDRTELVFWAMGAEGEQVAKLMPEFERRNPGISIRVQMIPWNAAHEKLLTAYASNSLPDMCQLGNTWIPEFTMLNSLERLDGRLAGSTTLNESGYFPGIWETNLIDSALYGIPWYVDTRVIFYRSDLLAKAGYTRAPRTWKEWLEVSRALVERKVSEYAVLLPANNEWAPQVIMGLQKGSTLLKENNTFADFSGEPFREAMNTFHRFFAEKLAPVQTTQIINVYQGMTDKIFAMYITGPWNIGEFGRRMPPELQNAWMTAPMPGPDSSTGVSLAGGSSLVMFSASKKKEAVWKVIEYLSEPEVQSKFYEITGDLPARLESWTRPPLAGNIYAAAFFEQLKHVVALPKIPEWEQIAQMVRQETELVSMDRVSVDDGMRELDRAVNLVLEKRRWMLEHAR